MPNFTPLQLMDMKKLPYSLQEWLRQLQLLVGGTAGAIPWSSINFTGSDFADLQTRLFTSLQFTGSNLTSIATRNHDDLQNIDGGSAGNYNHLQTALKGTKTAHDFGTVNAVNTATTTLTVTGATTTSAVVVSPTTALTAGLTVYGYVSSANTVTLVCVNASAGNIAAGTKTYNVMVLDN